MKKKESELVERLIKGIEQQKKLLKKMADYGEKIPEDQRLFIEKADKFLAKYKN